MAPRLEIRLSIIMFINNYQVVQFTLNRFRFETKNQIEDNLKVNMLKERRQIINQLVRYTVLSNVGYSSSE